ncbi:MAG TPA: translation elongation factor Ts [Candidatus Dormibacteraeota bacterium]|nr:translation elongation factor Ts [Candidatus Dormibacteraeota bacterium]
MAEISAAQVKQLRDTTGAGMMDCKRALTETGGDIERAKDWLREKGMARAASKAGRTASEGIVESYVHSAGGVGRVGVLVEVNCESDFVARTDDFKHLAHEIALHIAGASPQYARREEVPAELLERERNVYRAQVADKPANIQDKIVEGKLEAFYGEVVLLDQPYIREPKKKVGDLVKEAVAKLGENISVARFARFAVGETATAAEESPNGQAPAE